MRPLAAAVLALGLAGCGKDAPTGAAARDAAVAAWKAGSLQVSALTVATVPMGKDCQSGTVGAIDVVVCVYPTPAEAKAAEDAGLAWVGDTTGAAQARGTLLIAAADRRKSDPSGRTINQLMKLAPK